MIQKAIYYILVNDSDLSTALGTDDESKVKVYPVRAPQGVAMPYVVYELRNTDPKHTNVSKSTIDQDDVVITVVDEDYDDVLTIAGYVRTALDGTTGTYNSVTVDSIEITNRNDGYFDNKGGEGAYYYELTFNCFSR